MTAWSLHTLLNTLGWSLLDSLWQMGVLWLLYIVLVKSISRWNASQRHNLALVLLYAGASWFLIRLAASLITSTTSQTLLPAPTFNSDRIPVNTLINGIGLVYILLFLTQITLFLKKLRSIRGIQSLPVTAPAPELRAFIKQISNRMGIRKEIRLSLADTIDTPLTVGFWKPVILLPLAVMSRLDPTQVEAILLHELQHIKRNDYLHNIIVTFIEAILFFNPFAKALIATIRQEREHSCDDIILDYRYSPLQYAEALLVLGESRIKPLPALAMAATNTPDKLLLLRIRRLLSPPQPLNLGLGFRSLIWILVTTLFTCIDKQNNNIPLRQQSGAAFAQPPKTITPAFNHALKKQVPVSYPSLTRQSKSKNKRLPTPKPPALQSEKPEVLAIVALPDSRKVQMPINGLRIAATPAGTWQKRDYAIPDRIRPNVPKEVLIGLPYIPRNSFEAVSPIILELPAPISASLQPQTWALQETLELIDDVIRNYSSGIYNAPEVITRLAILKARLAQIQQQISPPPARLRKIVDL